MGILTPVCATKRHTAKNVIWCSFMAGLLAVVMCIPAMAGQPLRKCSITPQQNCGRSMPRPQCGIELTCTDQPVQLGYSDGVCFRATCPGIWGVTHRRIDQASYRRRVFTYRHYHFTGYWDLKDQGAVQSGPVPLRELFLVLPDDLIELRLADPDCNARIEIKNLGYVKKGSVCELQKWLAYQSYLDGPALRRAAESESSSNKYAHCPVPYGDSLWSRIVGLGQILNIPTCW